MTLMMLAPLARIISIIGFLNVGCGVAMVLMDRVMGCRTYGGFVKVFFGVYTGFMGFVGFRSPPPLPAHPAIM